MVSLLNALERESVERIRFLAKFVEKEYEKVDRLLELRERFAERLARADAQRAAALSAGTLEWEDEEQEREVTHLERLEAGLLALQMVDFILASIVVEDDGLKEHAKMLLRRKGQSLADDVVQNLQAYYYEIGDEAGGSEGAESEGGRQQTQKEVIVDLVNQLLNEE